MSCSIDRLKHDVFFHLFQFLTLQDSSRFCLVQQSNELGLKKIFDLSLSSHLEYLSKSIGDRPFSIEYLGNSQNINLKCIKNLRFKVLEFIKYLSKVDRNIKNPLLEVIFKIGFIRLFLVDPMVVKALISSFEYEKRFFQFYRQFHVEEDRLAIFGYHLNFLKSILGVSIKNGYYDTAIDIILFIKGDGFRKLNLKALSKFPNARRCLLETIFNKSDEDLDKILQNQEALDTLAIFFWSEGNFLSFYKHRFGDHHKDKHFDFLLTIFIQAIQNDHSAATDIFHFLPEKEIGTEWLLKIYRVLIDKERADLLRLMNEDPKIKCNPLVLLSGYQHARYSNKREIALLLERYVGEKTSYSGPALEALKRDLVGI